MYSCQFLTSYLLQVFLPVYWLDFYSLLFPCANMKFVIDWDYQAYLSYLKNKSK